MGDPEYNSEEWNLFRQDFTDQQDVEIGSPRAVGLAGGLALLAFQLLLPLLAPLLSLSGSSFEGFSLPSLPPLSLPTLPAVAERPRLQNHPNCGVTTGGQVRFVCLLD